MNAPLDYTGLDIAAADLVERMAGLVAARLKNPGRCFAEDLVEAGFTHADTDRHFYAATSRAWEILAAPPAAVTQVAGPGGAAIPIRATARGETS